MPGYHLPYLGGAADGLFAEMGIDVEVADPNPGGPENILQVAAGHADFCLTSVAHYLAARDRSPNLAARFVAVISQRSPISAIVRADSDIHEPADLAGRRLGGPSEGAIGALVKEYCAILAHLDVGPPIIAPMDYSAGPMALANGDVDALADYVDLLPRLRRQSGINLRAIPFNMDIYASGIVAADSVPAARVAKMCAALVVALEQQRREPTAWLPLLLKRWPDHYPDDVLESWALAEPRIFADRPVGSMNALGWERTVTFLSAALGLAALPPNTVYRHAFLGNP